MQDKTPTDLIFFLSKKYVIFCNSHKTFVYGMTLAKVKIPYLKYNNITT